MYVVQRKAWMDTSVWHDEFADKVWEEYACEDHLGPLALLVDNLKCHISDDSVAKFASLGTEIVALPKNTAAVLQPLDVGVMGPF